MAALLKLFGIPLRVKTISSIILHPNFSFILYYSLFKIPVSIIGFQQNEVTTDTSDSSVKML
jgi:hypothetical protein